MRRHEAQLTLTCELCNSIYKIGQDSIVTATNHYGGAARTIVPIDDRPEGTLDFVAHIDTSWPRELQYLRKLDGPTRIASLRESIAEGEVRYW